mmetsp:Transcript_51473/g.159635  ORF Transcript_51473/g.159635 Transcript_51473/m.159635 type:complete len:276 (+) Transcript_51473:452-1279(+)
MSCSAASSSTSRPSIRSMSFRASLRARFAACRASRDVRASNLAGAAAPMGAAGAGDREGAAADTRPPPPCSSGPRCSWTCPACPDAPGLTRRAPVTSRSSTKAVSCEATTTAPRWLRRPLDRAVTAAPSRWFVGSSRSSTSAGRVAKTASATRAFSPPLSVPIFELCTSLRSPSAPSALRAPSASSMIGAPSPSTYSTGVWSEGRSCARSCVKRATLALRREPAPTVRLPLLTSSAPARVRSSVDFPQPLGPRRASRLPVPMVTCTSSRIAGPPS